MAGTTPAKRIPAAVITAAHGIRGEVKLRAFTQAPLSNYNPLYLESDVIVQVTLTGTKDELVIARLSGVADRNAAEKLKGKTLFLDAHLLPPSTDDAPYEYELSGLEVRDATGAVLGRIADVADYGAGTVVEVLFENGAREMYPFKPQFFPACKPREGFVVLEKPEVLE